MNAYEYTAITENGKTRKGTAQADSVKTLRQTLRAQSLIAVDIKPVQVANKKSFFSRKKRVNTKALTLMTRQLATLLDADIPLADSLQGVAQQSEGQAVKQLVLALKSKVTEGYSLSQALDSFPQVFSDLYRASVAAAEASGDLSKVLLSLADYLEQQQALRAKITQAMIYPSFVMGIALLFTMILMVTVVPQMLEVFSDQDQALPTVTLILLGVSGFLEKAWWLLVLGVIGGIFGFKKYCADETRRAKWHVFCLKMPIFSSMIKTVQTGRFMRTLAVLLHAGVPLLDALTAAKKVVTMLPMQQALLQVQQDVREGVSLHKALNDTGYFSPMSMHMIASGERAGKLEDMMQRAAHQQETEVEQTISRGLALFEPIMILGMGLVVLFIVLAVLLPVFSATQMF